MRWVGTSAARSFIRIPGASAHPESRPTSETMTVLTIACPCEVTRRRVPRAPPRELLRAAAHSDPQTAWRSHAWERTSYPPSKFDAPSGTRWSGSGPGRCVPGGAALASPVVRAATGAPAPPPPGCARASRAPRALGPSPPPRPVPPYGNNVDARSPRVTHPIHRSCGRRGSGRSRSQRASEGAPRSFLLTRQQVRRVPRRERRLTLPAFFSCSEYRRVRPEAEVLGDVDPCCSRRGKRCELDPVTKPPTTTR
jgi:hypothetical protein